MQLAQPLKGVGLQAGEEGIHLSIIGDANDSQPGAKFDMLSPFTVSASAWYLQASSEKFQG
jgi:hypothetical protein